MSSPQKSTVYKSIASFLKKEIEGGKYTSEVVESLEVAKQCLESAFNFSADDQTSVPDLFKIFEKSFTSSPPEPSEETKSMAETLKNQGNLCMKENQFEEALACYTKAIELSPNYAVYYCNRAAAYSRLNEHHKAIEDCQRALKIDPNYSKAYGRLGIAYSSLGEHAKAAAAYRKRLELDPTNENCQQNLNLTEERLGETRNAPSSGSSGGSGFDFGAVLNNPMMQNIAFQLLRDPHAQNVMADLFSSTFSGAPSSNASANVASPMADAAPSNQNAPNGDHPPASSEQTTSQPNMDQFMRLGQQLAQQLRATNPQLVDQLRQNFQSSFSSPDATDSAP